MTDQPDTTQNHHPAVWGLVLADMTARDSIGQARYGTRLQPFNGRDSLRDLYDELLDACAYIRQEIYERDALDRADALCGAGTFAIGDRVRKKSGSQWQGRVVGWYATTLTPEGYAVESETHAGSVQIYPAKALEKVADGV